MASDTPLPRNWEQRPQGFLTNWNIFCQEFISKKLSLLKPQDDHELATLLLVAGAVLGAGGLMALVQSHLPLINEKGKQWGIADLGSIALGGSAALGAALGGVGVTLLLRILGRFADPKKVNILQATLSTARRQFEEINQDRAAGRITAEQHRLAIERLYWMLTN